MILVKKKKKKKEEERKIREARARERERERERREKKKREREERREIFRAATMSEASASTKTPADFLKSIKGQQVSVKLNSGSDYKGVLACLDGYMNIAMEQTEEYNQEGQLKNKYGDCFIRGNNVLYIHAKKT